MKVFEGRILRRSSFISIPSKILNTGKPAGLLRHSERIEDLPCPFIVRGTEVSSVLVGRAKKPASDVAHTKALYFSVSRTFPMLQIATGLIRSRNRSTISGECKEVDRRARDDPHRPTRSPSVFCHHRQLAWLEPIHFLFDGTSLSYSTLSHPNISKLTQITQADLEDLVLSGKLFNGTGSGTSSPRRSPSPDAAKWPNDEYTDNYSDEGGSQDQLSSAVRSNPPGAQGNGVGVGVPGRTGVKGVIRDRNEAERSARNKRAAEIKELNKKMEKASLTGMTYLEEKALEQDEDDGELEELRFARVRDNGRTGQSGGGKFGHLREVGAEGFLKAVEAEERHVWVVLHLYHPVRFSDKRYPSVMNP